MELNSFDKVVIGTWGLGGAYGHYNKKQAINVIEYAYKLGFREFDTAPGYGSTEAYLGEVFSKTSDVKINSKFGSFSEGKFFSINALTNSIENTLKNINKDSLNVIFLHNPREEINNYDNIFSLFEDLKNAGLIKFSGLSMAKDFDYSPKTDVNKFDVLQNDLNLLYIQPLKLNYDKKVVFMARSPLASGILSGKMDEGIIFPTKDHRSNWLKGTRLNSILKRVSVIKRHFNDYDVSSLSFRFLLNNEMIGKIIFGVRNIDHVDKIYNCLNEPKLPDTIIKKIIDMNDNDFGLIDEEHLGY